MSANKEGAEAGVVTTPPAYNYQTAAEWLNITQHKLRSLVEHKKITRVKIARAVRFRLEDLEQYVAGCILPASSEGVRSLTIPAGVVTTPPAYNYQTAAEWLNITQRKLRRLVALRKITCVKMGNDIRFRLEDLDQYVVWCIRPALMKVDPPPGVGTSQQ